MSPRKAEYRVPKHIVGAIRSKTKSVLHGPYTCPACGNDSLRIIVSESSRKTYVRCKCGIKDVLDYDPKNEAIDYYNDYIEDQYK